MILKDNRQIWGWYDLNIIRLTIGYPYSWILETPVLVQVSEDIRKFTSWSMKYWNTALAAGTELLSKVDIKRGIFQGNSFSPLLFVVVVMLLTQKWITANSAYIFKIEKNLKHQHFMNDSKSYLKKKKDNSSLILTV